jgi:capsule polysaccharide export protein KpsE/RkpR
MARLKKVAGIDQELEVLQAERGKIVAGIADHNDKIRALNVRLKELDKQIAEKQNAERLRMLDAVLEKVPASSRDVVLEKLTALDSAALLKALGLGAAVDA